MQKAFINWVIIQDQSFLQSTPSGTRVMLPWNLVNLLASLPASAGAYSNYIMQTFKDRIDKIVALMATASSEIAISMAKQRWIRSDVIRLEAHYLSLVLQHTHGRPTVLGHSVLGHADYGVYTERGGF